MTMLAGHDAAWAAAEAALASARFHHGWMLAGPEGTGKAGFARQFAARIVDPGGAQRQLLDRGGHPDIILLTRELRDEGKELRRNITVDQIRTMQARLTRRPTMGERRAVIIDAADELEAAAANALLKSLEEPPAGTCFLLVAHSPGRLLPTIRSRCRLLRFGALSDDVMAALLERELPGASSDERQALSLLAGGSPGRALRYAGLELGPMLRQLDAIASGGGAARGIASAVAESVALKGANERYEAFLDLAVLRLAARARAAAADRDGGPMVEAWSEGNALAARARALTLDKAAVAFRICVLLAGTARHRDRAA